MWRSIPKKLQVLFVALILCGLAILCVHTIALQAPSAWFATTNPEFKVQNVDATTNYPSTYAQRGNIDCENLTFTHRDGDTLPLLPLHIESQQTGCYISTNIGLLDSNGSVNVRDSPYIADIVRADNTPLNIFAFPNSDVFISNTSASPSVGSYVWFDHLQTSLHYSRDNYGKIRAVISPQSQVPLIDANGNQLPVMSDNFGVSDNGDWAVVDSPGRALLRINLTTMEVLPFADSFEFGNGVGAQLKFAVSSDGRFVAVASKNYTYFRIFDLSTCSVTPKTITAPNICSSRNLDTFLRSKIMDMGGIMQLRFLTNNLLHIYATHDISASSKIGEYLLAAPGTSLSGMDYLALGDSFSSGEGAFKYELGTDEREINMCHLSTVSYPYLIAKNLSSNSFHSVACSGAKTSNLSGGSGIDKFLQDNNRDNQNIAKPIQTSLGDWLPGYQKQVNFVTQNQPNLITLSVLGNDIGFADIAAQCTKPGTCFPTYEDQTEVFNLVDSKLPKLKDTFKKVRLAAPNSAKIYAVAYPQIALPTGSCGLNVHMNLSELMFASNLITRINKVVKTAANQAGIQFADIENAFTGFRLCEAPIGKAAMNGLTAGTDIFKVIGNESYHPTEFGQFLMAQAILDATSNLGSEPSPADNSSLPDINSILSNLPKTGRIMRKRIPLTLSAQKLNKNKNILITLKGTTYATPPSASFNFSIDQNTVTVTSNQNGDITVDMPIPPTIDTGIHEIHIIGEDVTGQPIDLSGVIGITDPTLQSPCGITSISNTDYDQDGIDDACDPVISNPTTSTPQTPTLPSNTNNDTITKQAPNTALFAGVDTSYTLTPSLNDDTYTYATTYSGIPQTTAEQIQPFLEIQDSPDLIKKLAHILRDALGVEASIHPIGYIGVILTALFILFFLAYKYKKSQVRERIYIPEKPYLFSETFS